MAGLTRLSAQVNVFQPDNDFQRFADDLLTFFKLEGPIEIPSYDDYMKTRDYPITRKKVLTELREYMLNKATPRDKIKATRVDTFIKNEPYPEEKKPRFINPRSDEFKAVWGNVLHAVDEFVFAMLETFLVKNMTTAERTTKIYNLFKDSPKVSTSDYTGMENSVREDIMWFECRLLIRLLRGAIPESELQELIAALSYRQFCYNKSVGVGMNLATKRMSGELLTAVMNLLTNLLVHLYAYKKELYDELLNEDFFRLLGSEIRILLEGDDTIHACVRGQLTEHWFERCGFVVKLEHVDSIDKASFCGQVFNPKTHTLTTSPIKFLLKFGWGPIKYHSATDKVLRMLTTAKAYSYAFTFPQCPIIYPICYNIIKANRFAFNQVKYKLYDMFDPYMVQQLMFKVHELLPPDIDYCDREYVAETWGIPVSVQYDLEEQCTPENPIWSVPSLDHFLDLKFSLFAYNQIRFAPMTYEEVDLSVVLH